MRQAHELPVVIEQPEVRRWYARMLIDRDGPGDRAKARELLAEAVAMYRKIGMPKHVEMAEALLGGCNLPPATSITRYLEYGNVCFHTHCAGGDGSRGPEGNGRRGAMLARARSRAVRVASCPPSAAAAGTTWLE